MRPNVHSTALRAATKVAFSVAFLGGCASNLAEDEDLVSSSDELSKGCAKDRKDASAPKPLSCEQVVAAAFPVEGGYPGAKKSVSPRVQTCCVELLEKSQGALAEHRWDCCANLPADAGQSVGIACTPWGPAVPPAMKRRAPAVALREVA